MTDTSFTMDRDKIAALKKLVEILRDKCPWDKKQTSASVAQCLIEEAYELVDAISSENKDHIKEELGDVLFQVVFIACLYNEQGLFSLDDSADTVLEKMIRRHPHVFGDVKADTAEKVKENWAAIKEIEKKEEKTKKSLLDSVSKSLPALQRAYLISEKVGCEGFDWDDMAGVKKKTLEEWQEFLEAVESGTKEQIELEFGDILFTLINVARFAGVHPETALSVSINKFEKRYRHMEKRLIEADILLSSLTSEEKEKLWEKAKKATEKTYNSREK